MSNDKYDWSAIQIEFFTSDCTHVTEFFKQTNRVYTGHSSRMTKGWAEQKRQFLDECAEIAKGKLREEISKKYEVGQEKLMKCKNQLFAHIEARLFGEPERDEKGELIMREYIDAEGNIKKIPRARIDEMSTSDMMNLFKMIKIEAGEPIYIKADEGDTDPLEGDKSDNVHIYIPDNGRGPVHELKAPQS